MLVEPFWFENAICCLKWEIPIHVKIFGASCERSSNIKVFRLKTIWRNIWRNGFMNPGFSIFFRCFYRFYQQGLNLNRNLAATKQGLCQEINS